MREEEATKSANTRVKMLKDPDRLAMFGRPDQGVAVWLTLSSYSLLASMRAPV